MGWPCIGWPCWLALHWLALHWLALHWLALNGLALHWLALLPELLLLLGVGWLAWHRSVHGHPVPVHARQGGAGGERGGVGHVGLGHALGHRRAVLGHAPLKVGRLEVGRALELGRGGGVEASLRRVALGKAARVAVAHRRHAGDVRVGAVAGRHLRLALVLELLKLLVCVELLVVHCVPARVLLELIPLRLLEELVVADHVVLVPVALLEHMLPHPLHLLLPLPHIVLGGVGVVGLVQLLLEQNPHLVLVPLVLGHRVLQLVVDLVLRLHLLHLLLHHLPFLGVIDRLQPHLLLKLLLHLVLLEVLPPGLVRLLQVV